MRVGGNGCRFKKKCNGSVEWCEGDLHWRMDSLTVVDSGDCLHTYGCVELYLEEGGGGGGGPLGAGNAPAEGGGREIFVRN